MPKYQHLSVSADLHLWYDVWVRTAEFSINFLGSL